MGSNAVTHHFTNDWKKDDDGGGVTGKLCEESNEGCDENHS